MRSGSEKRVCGGGARNVRVRTMLAENISKCPYRSHVNRLQSMLDKFTGLDVKPEETTNRGLRAMGVTLKAKTKRARIIMERTHKWGLSKPYEGILRGWEIVVVMSESNGVVVSAPSSSTKATTTSVAEVSKSIRAARITAPVHNCLPAPGDEEDGRNITG